MATGRARTPFAVSAGFRPGRPRLPRDDVPIRARVLRGPLQPRGPGVGDVPVPKVLRIVGSVGPPGVRTPGGARSPAAEVKQKAAMSRSWSRWRTNR